MRILMVCAKFYPSTESGGVVRFTYDLATKLVASGHDVTVYTSAAMDSGSCVKETNQIVDVEGIKVRYFQSIFWKQAWSRKLWVTPRLIKTAKDELHRFDIIHMHELRTFQNIVVRHYAREYGIPYVFHGHGDVALFIPRSNQKHVFDLLFGHRILRDASKLITMTRLEIHEYKKMGMDEDKIITIPVAYDVDSFHHLPTGGQFRNKFSIKEKHIILFLGRIALIKGIDFLVQSFHELAKERDDTILVIAGPDDGYRPTLEGLIKRLNLSPRVVFTGFLDGEDKLAALVDATMLVQTSIYERGPGSPFEAVLCGTPIIVTKDTGCGEMVAEADAGYLVQYGNLSELTNTMRQILDDPAEARDKAQKGRQYIIENLSWQRIIEKYERLYESAIGLRSLK